MKTAKNTQPCPRCCRPVRRHRAIYCSQVCAQAANRARNLLRPKPLIPLTSGTTGAVSELVAATDLLRRGYEVFRSLSPACSCDLVIATATGKLLRVEVRTAFQARSGRLYYGTEVASVQPDVWALVTPSGVFYKPELVETCGTVKNATDSPS